MKVYVLELEDNCIKIGWDRLDDVVSYQVYWADRDSSSMVYKLMSHTMDTEYTLHKASHIPHYFKIVALMNDGSKVESDKLRTDIKKVFYPQLEKLSRGLIAVKTENGIFLSFRLFVDEVTSASKRRLIGSNFDIYRNGEKIAYVTDSTNYMDELGTMEDEYHVVQIHEGVEKSISKRVKVFSSGSNYIDLPIKKPEGGITPSGEVYEYVANDMSVGDVDGDGEYEYFVKWEPTNSHDVSIKGYTGNCYIDCYKLDGTILWRLDMGKNIRAGAHYTQFMVYDFNLDGKVEVSVKTAPGTNITRYHIDGTIQSKEYITLQKEDMEQGVTHDDNYVCSAMDYRKDLIHMFQNWHNHNEVIRGRWPKTLEECFGIQAKYTYPLSVEDATKLVEYFINVYAPSRSSKNELDKFEGFIYKGPEYLTMFTGTGEEIETIPFKYGREDDGLLWGDYSMNRIEPCNRVDRFLSGVAYLDGERPYLIIGRGYYTRTTIVAYDFFHNTHKEYFSIDSGFVPMDNPFHDNAHEKMGEDPVYGILAGQGNHSLSTADVDGDGYHEIIYGGAVIDHDGSILYSSYGYLPDGTYAKFGHGDAMHVANINPDKPGLEIFNVFEGGKAAPYGYALRDAETGEVIFGEYAETDLGRCMIGDIVPEVRGLQVWVHDTYSCKGEKLEVPLLGTNQSIRYLGDMTTQILDGNDLFAKHTGKIVDNTHGIILEPKGVLMNNGTKGNPCLVADIFGDFREELLVRLEDNTAIRIYTNTDITDHKLFTLMHDIQYRTGIAWQNNCYNQPTYPSFYYASDMDFRDVMPQFAGHN